MLCQSLAFLYGKAVQMRQITGSFFSVIQVLYFCQRTFALFYESHNLEVDFTSTTDVVEGLLPRITDLHVSSIAGAAAW